MKFLNGIFSTKSITINLRAKIMLVFILPMVISLTIISYVHNEREREELESAVEDNAWQLANIMLGSLKHAMLGNNSEMMTDVMGEFSKDPDIRKVWLLDLDSTVIASTDSSDTGKKLDMTEKGCVECHTAPPGSAEIPGIMEYRDGDNFMRVVLPIPNAKECQSCHPASESQLGVFFMDFSMVEVAATLQEDLINNILLSAASLAMLFILALLLIQWLITRRTDVISAALRRLENRDFSTRISTHWYTRDEITDLAAQINNMASSIEGLQAEQKSRELVRVNAIIEERERIARELHDGVAQFLGYLSAKIGAARMALSNQKNEMADANLAQVEQSIVDQSIEVRSTIVGLKISGMVDTGLVKNIRAFVEQCNRLGDFLMELEIPEELNSLEMNAEKEMHIFRILQEAVSNVRKHSGASQGSIRLEMEDDQLKLSITDDGVGFDPVQVGMERSGHFGLQIMFERAREIGARLEINSKIGSGTTITVIMDWQESAHAGSGR